MTQSSQSQKSRHFSWSFAIHTNSFFFLGFWFVILFSFLFPSDFYLFLGVFSWFFFLFLEVRSTIFGSFTLNLMKIFFPFLFVSLSTTFSPFPHLDEIFRLPFSLFHFCCDCFQSGKQLKWKERVRSSIDRHRSCLSLSFCSFFLPKFLTYDRCCYCHCLFQWLHARLSSSSSSSCIQLTPFSLSFSFLILPCIYLWGRERRKTLCTFIPHLVDKFSRAHFLFLITFGVQQLKFKFFNHFSCCCCCCRCIFVCVPVLHIWFNF